MAVNVIGLRKIAPVLPRLDALRLSPDNRYVITSRLDGIVRKRLLVNGNLMASSFPQSHLFNPNISICQTKKVMMISNDHYCTLLDLESMRNECSWKTYPFNRVCSARSCFSANGEKIITVYDSFISVRYPNKDSHQNRTLPILYLGSTIKGVIWKCICVTPDGQYMCCTKEECDNNTTIWVISLSNGCIHYQMYIKDAFETFVLSPDGKHIAYVNYKGNMGVVRHWAKNKKFTKECVKIYNTDLLLKDLGNDGIVSICIAPDNKHIVGGSIEGRVYVVNFFTRQVILDSPIFKTLVVDVCVTKNNQYIVCGSQLGGVFIFLNPCLTMKQNAAIKIQSWIRQCRKVRTYRSTIWRIQQIQRMYRKCHQPFFRLKKKVNLLTHRLKQMKKYIPGGEITCPIGLHTISDPVFNPCDGKLYERKYLLAALVNKQSCPTTRKPLTGFYEVNELARYFDHVEYLKERLNTLERENTLLKINLKKLIKRKHPT